MVYDSIAYTGYNIIYDEIYNNESLRFHQIKSLVNNTCYTVIH